jgi:hypothetical protein
MRPHIYRTHDGGRTWTEIAGGIPGVAPTNAVREDPIRQGLLFAATEREVCVSFDDGGHWQTLRLNMAPTSVRDIIVKDNDLVAATHGRGFWILDDISPLRQIDAGVAAAEAILFKPGIATRVRYNMNTDTPLPPDEPGGENPPDGAVIDYALKTDIPGSVTLEIADAAGRTIRRYSSEDKGEFPTPESAPVPLYWYRKPLKLQTTAGMHRFLWDMRYQPLEGGGGRGGGRGSLPISATPFNTVPTPNSIWAPAGLYTIKLTVGGQTLKQPLALRTDPRVKTTAEGLRRQAESSLAMYDGILAAQDALQKMRTLRGQIKKVQEAASKAQVPAGVTEALAAFDKKAADLEGGTGGPGGPGGAFGGQMGPGAAGAQDTLASIGSSLNSLMTMLQASDTAPTSQLAAAVAERKKALEALLGKWDSLRTRELAVLNGLLNAAKLEEIKLDK